MGQMLLAQSWFSLHSEWDDALHSWELEDENDVVGELKVTWPLKKDWFDWSFILEEDIHGSIRRKWRDDPSIWELHSENQIVTARMRWRGDRNVWRIESDSVYLVLTTYRNFDYSNWELESKKYGNFYMYSEVVGDMRDWVIEDFLEKSVSRPVKMMLIFLCLYNSII